MVESVSGNCKVCGKEFKKKIYPWSSMDFELYYWRAMFHYLFKHRKIRWNLKITVIHVLILTFDFMLTLIKIPAMILMYLFSLIYGVLCAIEIGGLKNG